MSLDGQGRVEDHWIQTELGGVTYLDTEPWRGEPLLTYLRKMVFWADVTVEAADLAVLSLLGPRLSDPAVLDALGVEALPAQGPAVAADRRGFPAPDACHRDDSTSWCPATRRRLATAPRRRGRAPGRRVGLRGAPGGRVATAAGRRHRRAHDSARGRAGSAARRGPLDKGCYRGQETVARVHNLGKPPRMLVLLHLDGSADRPATGDPLLAGGRAVGRLGTVVDHVDDGPIALALVKRGIPAETELITGGDVGGAPRSSTRTRCPHVDGVGAGRLAVDRLRGGQHGDRARPGRACQRPARGHGKVLAGQ